MAEDLDRSPKTTKAAWLKIFTGFKLALDPKKLVLAAAGIFVSYLGWWLISLIFFGWNSTPPVDTGKIQQEKAAYQQQKAAYEADVLHWTLLYELASGADHPLPANVEEVLKKHGQDALVSRLKGPHGHGLLRSCPWTEYRGPNQLTVVSDAVLQYGNSKAPSAIDALKKYACFVVEPLYKFLLPVVCFFDERAGGLVSWNRVYLVLIMLWTVFTWGYFGGAITRIVAVQFARNEKVGLLESLKFVCARWQGYLFAPLLPLVLLLVLSILLWLFGLVIGFIPVVGDLLAALLWPLSLIAGLIMAVVMVGLVGWPLMNATISTEGSDSFDALSRSYSYVYQAPWQCLAYALLSVAYGAVLIFFVGFMGTLLVYLGKWGVSQAPGLEGRDPSFLFVNAPTSFEWRDTLLRDSPYAVPKSQEAFAWWNQIGAYGVGAWLGLFFLLIIGFGYSYFWTAAGIIYMLIRQKVDDTDLDEVYLEEDVDQPLLPESPSAAVPSGDTATQTGASPQTDASPPIASPASSAPPGVTFTMVDPPPPPAPPAPNTEAKGKE